MKADGNVENMLRQDHIRPEDLLTDGPLNLNQQILAEDTTIGNTKDKKSKSAEPIHIRRQLYIVNHADVLDIFNPFVLLGISLLLLGQSLLMLVVVIS